MSWRGQGITGSNNIPLGSRRRFGDGDGATPPPEEAAYHSTQPSGGVSDVSYKRGRSPTRGNYTPQNLPDTAADCYLADEPAGDGTRRRKKRNRWGDATENKAAGLMGLPTAIMANMTSEQLEAYTLHLRIEEISQKLRIDDVVPADGDR
jgi:splicing factor 1